MAATLEESPPAPAAARSIPRSPHWDSLFAFLGDPYRHVSHMCDALGTDVFQTRLFGETLVCLRGAKAAQLFYDNDKFTRKGSIPGFIRITLFGRGGVQALEGPAHDHRKRMFLDIVTPEKLARIPEIATDEWHRAAERWTNQPRIVFYEEAREVLFRTACRWSGVPFDATRARELAEQTASLYEHAATIGWQHVRARLNRRRMNKWMTSVIEQVRAHDELAPEGSAARIIAMHRDLDGRLLPAETAAVELLSVVRPMMAVSVFVTHAAHALHMFPDARKKLLSGGETELLHFAQEVRRYYPFFPGVAAKVRRNFVWDGYEFQAGTRVLLDLYGCNQDARMWEVPREFRPERFRDRFLDPFTLMPQGGGDVETNHRCPGEGIAIELIQTAARFLTRDVAYDVPEQDLSLTWRKMPALPKDRLVLENVRMR